MSSKPFTRRLVAVVGGGALIATGALLAGCGNNDEQTPSTTTTTTNDHDAAVIERTAAVADGEGHQSHRWQLVHPRRQSAAGAHRTPRRAPQQLTLKGCELCSSAE